MQFIMGTVFSAKDNTSGFAIINDDNRGGLCYLQQIDLTDIPCHKKHLRGFSFLDEKVFAVAPSSLLIMEASESRHGPWLAPTRIISRPEWQIGKEMQGNLHAVHVSKKHKTVMVSFNSQCAVDILDLGGNLMERKYLWEIAPNLFLRNTKKNLGTFGIIKHIFEDEDDRVLLTISNIHGKNKGAIVDFETGQVVIEGLYSPHGGVVYGEQMYFCELRKSEIHASEIQNKNSTSRCIFKNNEKLFARGLTIVDGSILLGLCHFGKNRKNEVPRILEIDQQFLEIKREVFLPSFKGFSGLQVYAMAKLPSCLLQRAKDLHGDLIFYRKGKLVNPANAIIINNEGYDSKNSRSRTNQIAASRTFEKHPDDSNVMIKCDNVTLNFRRHSSIFEILRNKNKQLVFPALKELSFTACMGESIGIIGRNGSGKSTLSMICANIYKPDKGFVKINGKVQLLSIGVGFQAQLTGRENVYISSSLLGLKHKEIKASMPEIEEFAEIGEFMDEPVRTYSSGMKSRLAFAVATVIRPDILILDEIMATGDKSFQDKANARMKNLREIAKCVIIISHNPTQLRKLCKRVLWLEKGKLVMDGIPAKVLREYENFCKKPERWLLNHDDSGCIDSDANKIS